MRTLPSIRPILKKSLGPKEVRLRALSDTNVNFYAKTRLVTIIAGYLLRAADLFAVIYCAWKSAAVILSNQLIYRRRLVCFQVIRPYPVQSFDCTPIAH